VTTADIRIPATTQYIDEPDAMKSNELLCTIYLMNNKGRNIENTIPTGVAIIDMDDHLS
jgi:hypothetical protein